MQQISNLPFRWNDSGLQLNHFAVLQQVDGDPVVFVLHCTSHKQENAGKWTPAPDAQHKRACVHHNQK